MRRPGKNRILRAIRRHGPQEILRSLLPERSQLQVPHRLPQPGPAHLVAVRDHVRGDTVPQPGQPDAQIG